MRTIEFSKRAGGEVRIVDCRGVLVMPIVDSETTATYNLHSGIYFVFNRTIDRNGIDIAAGFHEVSVTQDGVDESNFHRTSRDLDIFELEDLAETILSGEVSSAFYQFIEGDD